MHNWVIMILSVDYYYINRSHSKMTRQLQGFVNQPVVDGSLVSALIFIKFLNNIIHELLDLLLFFTF